MADKNTEDPGRRKFLKNTGIAAGGVVGGSLLGGFLTDQFISEDTEKESKQTDNRQPDRARMFFNRFEDFVVLEQATELIFPKDDNGPGAIELDVPYYIDRQLAGSWGINGDDYRRGPFAKQHDNLESDSKADYARENRGKIFLEGLRQMNRTSQKRFDTTFDQANDDQKSEIMSDLEDGKIEMNTVPSDGFFALLKQATQEGAFCDPLYGGNKNMDGWRMKDFPGAQTSYRNVIEKDEFVDMEPVSLTDYQKNS
ncbi:gluconate 2-dehydrogenase subunit 3 family protein [Barrientosiimonas marina]|uniref:Gluconate 2-dehydrogenase subunit 3 family protein n=1 Tax=Lentibacillus kimchii TaxID=1542911 RepID=A0ABW2UTS9_9BACI